MTFTWVLCSGGEGPLVVVSLSCVDISAIPFGMAVPSAGGAQAGGVCF